MPEGYTAIRRLDGKEPWVAAFNKLLDEMRTLRVQRAPGMLVSVGSGGTRVVPITKPAAWSGATTTQASHPFKIQTVSTNSGLQFQVNPHSFLWKSPTGTTVPIENLDDTFDVGLGELVVLKVELDEALDVVSAYLQSGPYSSAWPSYTNPIERDATTKKQTALYIPIAEGTSTDDSRTGVTIGVVKVVNQTTTDICLFLTSIEGRAAVIGVPWVSHNQVG